MSSAQNLAMLFRRDLSTLLRQIEAFPGDETLWKPAPGFANPAGNLVLHLEGNLRDFVGRLIGGVSYERVRDLEFSSKGLGKQELIERVTALRDTIPPIISPLSREQMDAEYPKVVLNVPLSTEAFLIHLHGHLNWHLGQIDSLRRFLTGQGAVPSAGL